MRRHAPARFLLVAGAVLLAVAALHLVLAREGPDVGAVFDVLLARLGLGAADPHDIYLVEQVRLPRLFVAIFGGGSLALAGAAMQAAFRNPLAAPDVVGTAAGAAFGGALAIVLGYATASVLAVPLFGLAGALLVTVLVFALAGSGARFSVAGLLLAGVALNTLVGAVTSFVVTFKFDNYTASSKVLFWLMGGLDARTWEHVTITGAGGVLFGVALLPLLRELDLLTLRDDSVRSLGVDAARARQLVLLCACGLTATTVANTGGIAFLGLVVPHLARLLVGPAHRILLPASAVLGGIVLVLSDLVCRLAPPDANLRLGVVTAALGAPYFLFLLARHRRGELL